MRPFLTTCFLAVALIGRAQSPHWLPGTVVTTDSVVVNGEVAFQTAELILFRADEFVKVFTPTQLLAAHAFDKDENLHHRYVAYGAADARLLFYEVVVPGPVRVLRLLQSKMPLTRVASDRDDYDYFVATTNRLVRLHRFYRELFPELVAENEALASWTQTEALHPREPGDAIRIVQKFNQTKRDRWQAQRTLGQLF
jgi:hypothetical protein